MDTLKLALLVFFIGIVAIFALWVVSVIIGSSVIAYQKGTRFARNYRVGGDLK